MDSLSLQFIQDPKELQKLSLFSKNSAKDTVLKETALLENENNPFFGIYQGKELCGYLHLIIQPSDLNGLRILIDRLYIDPAKRGQGLGQYALKSIVENYPPDYAITAEKKDMEGRSFIQRFLQDQAYTLEDWGENVLYRFSTKVQD